MLWLLHVLEEVAVRCPNCGDEFEKAEGVKALDEDGEVTMVCGSQCRLEIEDD